MPYVKDTFIEPKLFYAIIGLAVSNLIAVFVMLAVLAATDDVSGPSGVALCRERYRYAIDGSDDEHVCEAVTAGCQPGTKNARCLDDPTACEAVLTSASGDDESNQDQACFFTAATITATGEAIAPPPLQQLTCFDHDQRAGVQNFPCPLTPGTEATPWLSTAPMLRSDAASLHCPPSATFSCAFDYCCTRLPAALSCSDTNGNGVFEEDGDLFDCRAPWRATPDQVNAVVSSYNVDPTAPCDRDAGGCTPFDCCTIAPSSVEAHDTAAETYPSTAVERFYEGLDTKDIGLMRSKVADGYQAIFTEGCVEVGGGSHCGAALYDVIQLGAFVTAHPSRESTFGAPFGWVPGNRGSARVLTTTMDNTDQCASRNTGGCGVVTEEYVAQQTTDGVAIRTAAVHKVEGGLIKESIWYTNARGKSQTVGEFYTQMGLCGSDNEAACDELDRFVDQDYILIISPSGLPLDPNFRPAAVGGMRTITPSPGATMDLAALKTFLKRAPARCTPGSTPGAAGNCQSNDRKTYDQQGNSVIERYTKTVRDIDDNQDYEVEGISVNRFVNDASATSGGLTQAKIVETYFYSQHADEQCSDAGRARMAEAFLTLIDDLSMLPPGTGDATRGQFMHRFDRLYWHDGDSRVGTFTAVMTSGTHTIGRGIRWQSGNNRIYDENGFSNLIQHTTATAGLGVDNGRAVHYQYCVAEADADPAANPPVTARHWQCLSRQYVSQGDNVFVQYQVYAGDRDSPVDQPASELGGVLLTFDEEKISQAYWCVFPRPVAATAPASNRQRLALFGQY